MKLKNLHISLIPSYRDDAGKYEGEIEYEGQVGSVKMVLSPDVSNALLICIGETITAFATKAAQEVQTNLIASVEEAKKPQLEASTTAV